jgi:hypothetical protein
MIRLSRLLVLIAIISTFSLTSSSSTYSSETVSLRSLLLEKTWQITQASWNTKMVSVDLSKFQLKLNPDQTFVCTDFSGKSYSGEWLLVEEQEKKKLPTLVLNPKTEIQETYQVISFLVSPYTIQLEKVYSRSGEANITYRLQPEE